MSEIPVIKGRFSILIGVAKKKKSFLEAEVIMSEAQGEFLIWKNRA